MLVLVYEEEKHYRVLTWLLKSYILASFDVVAFLQSPTSSMNATTFSGTMLI